jgi:hypothetical protein
MAVSTQLSTRATQQSGQLGAHPVYGRDHGGVIGVIAFVTDRGAARDYAGGRTYDPAMRRDQLKMAKRGIDLLLAHLKGTEGSLDTALANEDEDALIVAADPLAPVRSSPQPVRSTASADFPQPTQSTP